MLAGMSRTDSAGPGPVEQSPPDWSTLALELYCPRCGYSLRMLTSSRCPECGLDLNWDRIVASAKHQATSPLFEYRWRTRPFRSYIDTMWLCFRPWRLWREIEMENEPRVGGLILFSAITLFAFWLAWFLWPSVNAIIEWNTLKLLPGWGKKFLIEAALWDSFRAFLHLLIGTSIWLFMQVFQQTLTRYRIRRVQLLRIVALTYAPFVVISILDNIITMFHYTLFRSLMPINGGSEAILALNAIVEAPGVAIVYLSLGIGLTRYLRIQRGWSTATALMCLVFLFWITLCLSTLLVDWRWLEYLVRPAIDMFPGLGLILSKVLGI